MDETRPTYMNEERSELIIALFHAAILLNAEMSRDLSAAEQQALVDTVAAGGKVRLVLELGNSPLIRCLSVAPNKQEVLLFEAIQPKPTVSHQAPARGLPLLL